MAGLTVYGFTAKTYSELVSEHNAALLAGVSPTLNLSSTSLMGQWVGATSAQLRQLWEAILEVYNSMDIDQAEGDALTARCKIVGVYRRAATKSTVDVTLTMPAGTYAAGTQVLHVDGDPEARFVNRDEIVSSGTELTGVPFVAETAGAVRANQDTLTQIAAGAITEANNPSAAATGLATETDFELRVRWRQSQARIGSTSVDAIRADILEVANVVGAVVLENVTDTTDANGIPSRAIACYVRGGTDSDVAQAIYGSKAAGIQTHGTTSVSVVDSQGQTRTIRLTRPAAVPVYVVANVTVLSGAYPAHDNATVAKVVSQCGQFWGDRLSLLGALDTGGVTNDGSWEIGQDVLIARIRAAIMLLPGVVDVTALTIGTAPSPVGTSNLVMTVSQYAVIDADDVTVNLTTVTSFP